MKNEEIKRNVDLKDIEEIERPMKEGEIERMAFIWCASYQGSCKLKGDYYSKKGALEYNVYDFVLSHAVYPYYPYEKDAPRAFCTGGAIRGIPPEDRERFIDPRSNSIYHKSLGELALYIINNERTKKGKDYTLKRMYEIFHLIRIVDDIPGQFYPVFKEIKEYYRNYKE